MRFYAEWLDGEYVLLNKWDAGYNHSLVMQRAIRFHALFGSTVVLSDIQMADFRNPIPRLFENRHFRSFLRERQSEGHDFLSLVAEPVSGTRNTKLAIALKGVARLHDQANKPEDSYEMAVTRLGPLITKSNSFDSKEHLRNARTHKGQVGRLIRHFPKYETQLIGLLQAINHFSEGSLPSTTKESTPTRGQYDTLLKEVQQDESVVNAVQAKRIQAILNVQEQKVPADQHGRRAAIRKVLAPGPWLNEDWDREKLRLYLDVVHAWNCTINEAIAPEAGTLYEEQDDIPLSRFRRSTIDQIGWISGGPMPSLGVSNSLRRFLSWKVETYGWPQIASIVRKTRSSAMTLQACLETGSREDRDEALKEHAVRIGECLTNVPVRDLPVIVWSALEAAISPYSPIPSGAMDDLRTLTFKGRFQFAKVQGRRVINTLIKAGSELLR